MKKEIYNLEGIEIEVEKYDKPSLLFQDDQGKVWYEQD